MYESIEIGAYQRFIEYRSLSGEYRNVLEENEKYREGIRELYLSICKGGTYGNKVEIKTASDLLTDIEGIDDGLRKYLDKALEEME